MKLAPFLALTLPLAALTGCLGGTDDPVDANNVDPAKDLAITIEKNADGSFTFKVPQLTGLDYTWDFGDLTTGKGATAKHTYAVKSGIFSVVVTAKDAAGNIVRAGKQHMLGTGANAAPSASISLSTPLVKVGEAFAVDASASKDADGDTLRVTWLAVAATDAPTEQTADSHAGHLLTGTSGADGATAGGDAHAHAAGLPDTGNLAKGATKGLTFTAAGVYQYHCHPHPYMVGKIVVEATGAKNATVDIVESSYQPSIVRIAAGGTVTFKNQDTMVHTATVSAFVPKGTILPLTTLKGNVTLSEKGAFDLILVLEDGKGQMTTATKRVTVGDEAGPATFEETFEGTFDQPVLVPVNGAEAAKRHSFEISYPGHAIVKSNQTTGTPGAGMLHFKLLDEAGAEIASGADISVQLPAGTFFVEAAPAEGENVVYGVSYAIAVLVHLDMSGAPAGGDGHGHQH